MDQPTRPQPRVDGRTIVLPEPWQPRVSGRVDCKFGASHRKAKPKRA